MRSLTLISRLPPFYCRWCLVSVFSLLSCTAYSESAIGISNIKVLFGRTSSHLHSSFYLCHSCCVLGVNYQSLFSRSKGICTRLRRVTRPIKTKAICMSDHHIPGINDDDSLEEIAGKVRAFVKRLPRENETFRFITRAEVVEFMRADCDDMTLYLDVGGEDPAILRSPQWPAHQVVARITNADVIRDIALNPAPEFICRMDRGRLCLTISRPTSQN